MPLYRHLHLHSLGKASTSFRARGGGTTRRPPPVPDRADHAARLMLGLQSVENGLAEAVRAQREGGVPKKGRGTLFAIDGVGSTPLAVGSARADTRGINLLSLQRRSGASSNEGDRAVLFAKPTSVRSLQRSIERYADWVDEGDEDPDEFIDDEEDERSGRRPRNFWLLESAATIRPATLFDFWTDDPAKFPEAGVRSQWEVWTRKGYEESFAASVRDLDLREAGRRSEFVEVYVRNFVGTSEEVLSLVRRSAAVVQLRSASSFVGDFIRMDDGGRQRAIDAIASRIVPPPADAPRVAILDTGVDRTNPLLTGSLPIDRRHAAETVWTVDDHDGHGTKMAGVAQFGDLSTLVNAREPIRLATSLESVVVSPSDRHEPLPARDALERAVELVETDVALRIFCLAQTAVGENEDGRPSSTAAMLDRLAYNDGRGTRLFCAAVGNVPHSDTEPYRFLGYENRNQEYRTQAPAQAVNALSVGAVASKTSPAQNLVAPFGDLAPTSRTSQGWTAAGSYKPDIVMEGGNFVKVGTGADSDEVARSYRHDVARYSGMMSPAFEGAAGVDFDVSPRGGGGQS